MGDASHKGHCQPSFSILLLNLWNKNIQSDLFLLRLDMHMQGLIQIVAHMFEIVELFIGVQLF